MIPPARSYILEFSPLEMGEVSPEDVAQALEALYRGPEVARSWLVPPFPARRTRLLVGCGHAAVRRAFRGARGRYGVGGDVGLAGEDGTDEAFGDGRRAPRIGGSVTSRTAELHKRSIGA
jgi:hypothetical protein